MISVKLIGGAKKSFNSSQLEIAESEISIQELLDLLLKLKPHNTSDLDVENILIAINGSDSSAMNGKSTIVHDDDVVSIIPVIHGGTSKKLIFEIEKSKFKSLKFVAKKQLVFN